MKWCLLFTWNMPLALFIVTKYQVNSSDLKLSLQS